MRFSTKKFLSQNCPSKDTMKEVNNHVKSLQGISYLKGLMEFLSWTPILAWGKILLVQLASQVFSGIHRCDVFYACSSRNKVMPV